ncbi:hypothetical protein N7U66_00745 [Lacinutrix neustonica]|uniref:Uncharacterized protein n=1 Tax=Lacinutrix neustonica TaxID=2980107 RepID=A0A9E8MVW4_9FLAO|nr:hypothetical protein [Lacinutrix neustonica]WAC02321.1 hypothetical protein N7U66_00745 [Lacinutrix neustonica]
MITTKTENKYFEWLSAEEMHKDSKKWLSELRFVKDEHLFFQDLITSYTLQIIDFEDFSDTKEIIDALNRSQKKNNELIEDVLTHEKDLEIMVDGIDDVKKEKQYKKLHRQLLTSVSEYLYDYKKVKTQLFDILKDVMKKVKQQRLLDNR